MKNPKSNSGDCFVANLCSRCLLRGYIVNSRKKLLSVKALLYACLLLFCIESIAVESRTLPNPAAPASDRLPIEPCLYPGSENASETPGRAVKIQAWLCGKGVEEVRMNQKIQFYVRLLRPALQAMQQKLQ